MKEQNKKIKNKRWGKLVGKEKRWGKLKYKKLRFSCSHFSNKFSGSKVLYFKQKGGESVDIKLLLHENQLHCIPWKWWNIYNHAFVVTMTLAKFWKLVILSCDSFILIIILFYAVIVLWYSWKSWEGGRRGGGRDLKNMSFVKNKYCEGC